MHLADHAGRGRVKHPYDALTPSLILAAVESVGFPCDGRLLALNSFENRVYQIGLEDRTFLVAKFYRPQRWSDAQILEEHAFAAELVAAEVPIVAPLARGGQTLFEHAGFRFALFPRRGGRAPELESLATAEWVGRSLARLHNVGATKRFTARPALAPAVMIADASRAVLASPLLPAHLASRYRARAAAVSTALEQDWRAIAPATLRLHGDCHPGNLLGTDEGLAFVDLDDARSGPAVQDFWMLLTGSDAQREALIEGYEQFREFDRAELALIEPLKLLRQIHYAGWIAARWDDPAFPRAFPFAAEPRWWEAHVEDLATGE